MCSPDIPSEGRYLSISSSRNTPHTIYLIENLGSTLECKRSAPVFIPTAQELRTSKVTAIIVSAHLNLAAFLPLSEYRKLVQSKAATKAESLPSRSTWSRKV